MLTQKVPYIRVFKLVSSEEIITKVVGETAEEYMIEKPYQPMTTLDGVQWVPYMWMGDTSKPVPLHKNNVIMDAPPLPKSEAYYQSLVTGIAVPEKSAIVI